MRIDRVSVQSFLLLYPLPLLRHTLFFLNLFSSLTNPKVTDASVATNDIWIYISTGMTPLLDKKKKGFVCMEYASAEEEGWDRREDENTLADTVNHYRSASLFYSNETQEPWNFFDLTFLSIPLPFSLLKNIC